MSATLSTPQASSSWHRLTEMENVHHMKIRALDGEADLCQRLREVGFCEGMHVDSERNGRNFICRICGAKLALGTELARCIWVEEDPSCQACG